MKIELVNWYDEKIYYKCIYWYDEEAIKYQLIDKFHNNNKHNNGFHYGVYYYDNEEEEIIDVKWFKTIKQRKQYLRGVKC
tara:strand:- start:197 stop:436 length:240 start_codon:yes stop_codon:yes gene_type:complete